MYIYISKCILDISRYISGFLLNYPYTNPNMFCIDAIMHGMSSKHLYVYLSDIIYFSCGFSSPIDLVSETIGLPSCAGNLRVSALVMHGIFARKRENPKNAKTRKRENAKTRKRKSPKMRKRAQKYQSAKAGQLHSDFNGIESPGT